MEGTRLLANVASSEAYDRGVSDRSQSDNYHNPFTEGSVEARQYYEGWCEKNLIEFRNRFGS